jgi:hypothetical protein
MDGLTKVLGELLLDIWNEIKQLPNSNQKITTKLNAAFGLIVAAVIVLLFAASFMHELASVISAIRGKEVQDASIVGSLIAFLTLVGYFVFCVVITRPHGSGPSPRNP